MRQTGNDIRKTVNNITVSYNDVEPDAYETLLNDVMLGDAKLFMRLD